MYEGCRWIISGGLLAEARYIGSRTWFPSCASVARRAPPSQGQLKGRTVFEALWAYNLDPDDLSFAARDVITIVEETNADRWLRKGASPSWLSAADSSVNASPPPVAGTNSVGPWQDLGQAGKKGKFGKYGIIMAHSAAGGVGFGAGAAIGGGLVRAIF